MKDRIECNPFKLLELPEKESIDPEKILKSSLTDGLIPRPTDPDFEAFCEYIELNKTPDTDS